MINLIKFRRSGLWLLSFIAALLVLSPSAGAWDKYAISGDNYNNWSPSWDDCKAFTNASGGFTGTSMTLTIDKWAGGNFRIYLHRNGSNDWDQYSISGSQQLVNGTTYNNLSQCGDGNDLSLPASATGKSVTFTLTTSQGNGDAPTSLKASWTDNGGSTQTYYLRGAFNSWTGTANQLTGTGNTRSVEVANWSNEKSGQDDGLKIVYNNNGSESWYGGSDITANGGSSDLSDKGGNINLPAAAEGETVTFTLTLNNNEPSSLSASWTDNGGGDDDDTNYPGLLGEWSGHNDWNNPDYTDWTKEGDWYVKTMTPASTSNIKFRIRYDDNGTVREYQPAANSVNTSVENGTEYSTWGRKTDEQHNSTFVINAVAGTTYKIYLNPAGGGKVKVTWTDNGGGNVEDPDQPIVEYSNDVQIFGDFSNISFTPYDGWQNWSSLQGTVKQNDNEYYYSFSPSRTGKVYFRFKVDGTNYQPTSANGSYKEVYCEENWDHDGARASSYTGDYINGSAYCWYVDVSSTDKVYTLHFRKDHSGYKRVTCTKADKPFAGRTLPVYPKGVTNKEGLNAYTGWPIYYLQASELNFERITPEYQMKKRADGKYELRVNMFDTQNVYVEKFTDATEKSKRYANRTFSLPNGIIKNAGRAYTAVYDPATKTLTFEDEGIEMPFLSMIGRDWKQNTVTNEDNPFKTPFALKDAGDYIQSYENKSRDTDYGWQEAWIQYSNNEILKDRKGNVMYTTMWPQSDANEVLFKTAFKVGETDYDFTLRGEQLTFVPQNNGVAKKGSEWKADARFSKVKKSGLQSNFSGIEYADVLALDDNTDYVLYSVDGMWVNGDVKLWTGWNGGVKDNTRYGSLWTANWGHYKALDSTTKITAGSTVPLGDAKGDMTFPEPTYFKSVDFFLNKSNPTKGSLLFTELATGGAEIAALSRENYTYGMYRPRLKNTANIQTQSLNSVTITTYKSDDDMNTTPINVVVNNTYSDKKVSDWDSLFAYNQVSDNEKWVYDTYKYENGNYKYVMVVNINGEDIKVESNPFTVFVGEATATLKTYQLVKREIPTSDLSDKGLGDTDYNYVTYSTRANDKTYLVKLSIYPYDKDNHLIEGATVPGNNLGVDNILDSHYDEPTGIIDVKEVTEAQLEKVDYSDGTRFRFSPKLLFIGKITGKNVEKVNFTNGNASIEELGIETGATAVMLKSSIKEDDFMDTFYAVGEPVFYHDLEGGKSSGFNYSYKWSPVFNYKFTDAEGVLQTKTGETDEVVIDDYLVFPEPKLIIEESRIEMFYGDSPESDNDDVISNHFSINVADNMDGYESDLSAVTLGDPDNNRDGARFQQIRTAIVVERPNITRRYIALAADFIKEEAKKDGLNVSYNFGDDDNSAPLMEALFDFYLGKEQVKMSNSMTYTDNGGNPEWFVYYTPTRKPSDIYYNVYDNDDINNDWDLATNLGITADNVTFQTKTMSHKLRKAFEELHIYERWQDGDIAGIRIQQNPPVNALKSEATQSSMARVSDSEKGTAVESDGTTRDTNIRVIGSGLTYDSNGDLIETVNVNIKFKSATKNSLARVDNDGNPYDMNDASYNGKDMHYDPDSNDDYFYVRIVDENGEDLVDANAISAKDLADGYTLKIEKNHGHYWDGQVDVVKANSLIKTMTLKMSHIYPFIYGTQVNDITVGASVATETTNAPARVMRKAEGDPVVSTFENNIVDSNSDTESDVIKSNPVEYTFVDGEVVTSVEGLEALLSDSVITGVGYIEVHGEGVEIYGADGIKIATGEGRYEVGAGVYVVRLNGRAEKVIVR